MTTASEQSSRCIIEIGGRAGQFNALCFDVSPKCHMGGETGADGEIWDSHRRLCLNL